MSGILLVLLLSAGCTGNGGNDEGTGTVLQTQTPSACQTGAPSEIAADDSEIRDMEKNLAEITSGVNSELKSVKESLKTNANAIAEYGCSSEDAGVVIKDNLVRRSYSISSLVFDDKGVVLNAYPDNYKKFTGLDMGKNDVVSESLNKKTPLLSDFFRMEEGFKAVCQTYPVFDKDGTYLGYVDMTYKSEDFLAKYIKPVTDSTEYDVFVIQTDGTEIYDTTPEEIGLNLFTDEAYSDENLQALAKRIVENKNGTGIYTFWDKEWAVPVEKKAVWDTAGIDGAEWRIVVTKSENGSTSASSDETDKQSVVISEEYEDLKEYVHNAAEFARNSGKNEAIAEFNDINGSFTDGEKYIFAYNMDGTVIALPFQKALLGEDRSETVDPNGADFINGLVDVAEAGGGSIYYVYTNPAHDYREELKLSYVEPVDENWFVGSGIYVPNVRVNFSADDIEELVLRVKSARQYAQDNEKEAAISEFNDIDSEFAKGSSYIFAYGTDGITLALPHQPELIGTDRLNFTDVYGVPVMKLEITEAENGGGFVYVQYLDPDYNESRFKLCYVLPVDENWFVGSGIYTESI